MARTGTFTDLQNENIRAALKRLMSTNNWSQRQVADALGVAQQSVSTFLSGATGASLALARKVAHQLKEELSDMIEGSIADIETDSLPEIDAAGSSLPSASGPTGGTGPAIPVPLASPNGPAGPPGPPTHDQWRERREALEKERELATQYIDSCFADAFDKSLHTLGDVDITRKIMRPYTSKLNEKGLRDWGIERMVPIWLGIVSGRRRNGHGTDSTSMILSLSLHLADSIEETASVQKAAAAATAPARSAPKKEGRKPGPP